MSIEFKTEEGRRTYLESKLDDLLTGVNDNYGKALMDELIARLDKTINDFNDEVEKLMGQLKENTDKKTEILQQLKSSESGTPKKREPDAEEKSDRKSEVLSEWEKRLESLE